MCFSDNFYEEKFQIKTLKSNLLSSIQFVRMVFIKLISAKVKVSSNHLKFCTGCFLVFAKCKKLQLKTRRPLYLQAPQYSLTKNFLYCNLKSPALQFNTKPYSDREQFLLGFSLNLLNSYQFFNFFVDNFYTFLSKY